MDRPLRNIFDNDKYGGDCMASAYEALKKTNLELERKEQSAKLDLEICKEEMKVGEKARKNPIFQKSTNILQQLSSF